MMLEALPKPKPKPYVPSTGHDLALYKLRQQQQAAAERVRQAQIKLYADTMTAAEIKKIERQRQIEDVMKAVQLYLANDEFDQATALIKQASTETHAPVSGGLAGLGSFFTDIRDTLNPMQVAQRAFDAARSVVSKLEPAQLKALREKIQKTAIEQAKRYNKYTQAALLPHGLQSKEARLTKLGSMHNSANFKLAVNLVLTYVTAGAWAAAIQAVTVYAQKRLAEIRAKQQAAIDEAATAKEAEAFAQAAQLTDQKNALLLKRLNEQKQQLQQQPAKSGSLLVPVAIASAIAIPLILM